MIASHNNADVKNESAPVYILYDDLFYFLCFRLRKLFRWEKHSCTSWKIHRFNNSGEFYTKGIFILYTRLIHMIIVIMALWFAQSCKQSYNTRSIEQVTTVCGLYNYSKESYLKYRAIGVVRSLEWQMRSFSCVDKTWCYYWRAVNTFTYINDWYFFCLRLRKKHFEYKYWVGL